MFERAWWFPRKINALIKVSVIESPKPINLYMRDVIVTFHNFSCVALILTPVSDSIAVC